MAFRHGRKHLRLIAVPALAAVLALPALTVSAPGVRAAGAADAQASEVVRLINGERAYRGKSTLSLDRYLAAKARDGSIWCPNDSSKVMAGRARDIAVSGYFSHNLRLCTAYTATDAMATWGYTGGRGEILSLNSGYGTGTVPYAYGCSPSVKTCPGSQTSTYYTVAQAMKGWMQSSGHYAIIVGSYNRVGCGAWVGANGTFYYACLFSMGGSPITTPKPVATPKPPGQSTAAPRSGGASASPAASVAPSPTEAPPWPTPLGASAWIVLPSAGTSPATAKADGEGGNGPGGTGLPPAAEAVLAAAGATAILLLVWLRLGPLRRFRSRGTR